MGSRRDDNHRHTDPDPEAAASDRTSDIGDEKLEAWLKQTAGAAEGASSLDPGLWQHILSQSRPAKRQEHTDQQRVTRPGAAPKWLGRRANLTRLPPVEPSSIPVSRWRRGIAGFLLVVALTLVALVRPDAPHGPEYGSVVRDAALISSPVPEHCLVAPLAPEEVLSLVLDPGRTGFDDPRTLFATPPSLGDEPTHTLTWLPEPDGSVQLGKVTVDVSTPTNREFAAVQSSLDRYLSCQQTGTNYQLWALESPYEIQRQILRGVSKQINSVGDITEVMLLEEIERLGPLPRAAEQYLSFARPSSPAANPLDRLRFGANASRADAFIYRGQPSVTDSHAWIGTQLVDETTGEVATQRGAQLDAPVPKAGNGAIPMVGVFILTQDQETGVWLVEWFIPSV